MRTASVWFVPTSIWQSRSSGEELQPITLKLMSHAELFEQMYADRNAAFPSTSYYRISRHNRIERCAANHEE